MRTNDNIIFAKAGEITTDANGIGIVIFTHPFENGVDYSIMLTYVGVTTVGWTLFALNRSQTGFQARTSQTISAAEGLSTDLLVAPATVSWIAIPYFNE